MTQPSIRNRPWTAAEDAVIRTLYATSTPNAIAKTIRRTPSAIKNRVNKLQLSKSDNPGRFVKGIAPWNKGVSYQAGGRSAETQFKVGQRRGAASKLYKPVGSERINKDGYLERKVNDDMPAGNRWKLAHLILWESAHGPLPAGHALIFKDGDKRHIALDNLEPIDRAELMRRNSIHNYGPEIAAIHQLQGAIQRQINKRLGRSS